MFFLTLSVCCPLRLRTGVFLWVLWNFYEHLFIKNTSGGCFYSRLTQASSLGGAFWKVLVIVSGDGFLTFRRCYLFCQQKTKTFGELFILRMSTFNSRWKESFYLNFIDVTISDKSFLNEIRSEQGSGHFLDLKPKVSLILLSYFCRFK